MPRPRAALIAAASFLAASCGSLHDDLSRSMLAPNAEWLVEPTDLGLDAEAFDLPVGNATLNGYLIRSPKAEGRTVVVFHGNGVNVSMLHPWYTFVHDAGCNVCIFDPRGFGRSTGEPSLRGLLLDTRHLLDWLVQQRGVDANKLAYYGISIGSIAALRTAAKDRAPAAMVLDDVPSPRDFIGQRQKERGEMISAVGTGFTEFAALPEASEPFENAAQLSMPSLWITGTDAPETAVVSTLRAYYAMGGDKQLWALPGTQLPPNDLLTHDGEYQRAVGTFLASALRGAPERIAVTWRPVEADASGAGRYQFEITAKGGRPAPDAPWAVQIASLDKDGKATFGKLWLEGERARVTLELPAVPEVVSATRVGDAARGEAATFSRTGTQLSRAAAWHAQHVDSFVRLDDDPPDPAVARSIAKAIQEREAIEPFPAQLEAEMTVVYVGIGRALARTNDAEDKAQAIVWLQRATTSAPVKPERHWWATRRATFGFRGESAIEDARALLKKLTGG